MGVYSKGDVKRLSRVDYFNEKSRLDMVVADVGQRLAFQGLLGTKGLAGGVSASW